MEILYYVLEFAILSIEILYLYPISGPSAHPHSRKAVGIFLYRGNSAQPHASGRPFPISLYLVQSTPHSRQLTGPT